MSCARATTVEADLYAVLGVSAQATPEEIRAAYRRKAKQCHPDAGGSHQWMIELIAAWEVLGNPVRRDLYDRQRAAPHDEVVASQWEGARQEAEAAAQHYPRDWAEFTRWADKLAGEVQASRAGRLATAAVAGLLVGAVLGSVVGSLVGLGLLAGGLTGLIVGTLGGAWTVRAQGSRSQ